MSAVSAAAAAAEEAVLKQRVLAREPALVRFAKRYLQWTREASMPGKSAADSRAALQEVLRDLALLEVSLTRHALADDVFEKEATAIAQRRSAVERAIAEQQDELVQLKGELERARTARLHMQEYDELLRIVHQVPSRAASQQALQDLDRQLKMHERELARLNGIADVRQKQFQMLLFAVQALETEISDADVEAAAGALANASVALADDADADADGADAEGAPSPPPAPPATVPATDAPAEQQPPNESASAPASGADPMLVDGSGDGPRAL